MPGGMRWHVVFWRSLKAFLTESWWWLACLSRISRAGWRNKDPGRVFHTLSIYCNMSDAVIDPPFATVTKQFFGKFPLGTFFRFLKMVIGRSFLPEERAVRTTVNRSFSWPVVLALTVFTPSMSMVAVEGKSNQNGISSMLPMQASLNLPSVMIFFKRQTWNALQHQQNCQESPDQQWWLS